MFFGAIAFVGIPVVGRVQLMIFLHENITVDLGQDGGGGDGERSLITVFYGCLVGSLGIASGIRERKGVQEEMISRRQVFKAGAHGFLDGGGDIEAIDGLVINRVEGEMEAELFNLGD